MSEFDNCIRCYERQALCDTCSKLAIANACSHKWISVWDRLPDAPEQGCTMVIVANYSIERKIYFIGAAEFQRGNFYDRYNERMAIDDPYWPITHWMPLPSAPENKE